jgi:hypothetical protein
MGALRRAIAFAALALAACGPVTYIRQVTRAANDDVEAARQAHAPTLAPYWYTLAVEYLAKAREEAGQSDYQAANRLGRKASLAARRAIEVALASSKRDAPPPPTESVP